MEGHALLKGKIKRNSKIILNILKNPLFKTSGPISIFGTKHPWKDGIQIFANKGPYPSSRGDNRKIIKLYREYLKKFPFQNYKANFNQTWH